MREDPCRDDSSVCYLSQVANATVAHATVSRMNDIEINRHRVARLSAAVERLCSGNKTEFGKRLGYQDGAFVRQMLAELRPVSEKTIRAIEALPGMKGWFDIDRTIESDAAIAPWPFSAPRADFEKAPPGGPPRIR